MISDGRWGFLSDDEMAALTAEELAEWRRYRRWLHDHPTPLPYNGWGVEGVDEIRSWIDGPFTQAVKDHIVAKWKMWMENSTDLWEAKP
jgi:hypothetical protein